MLHYMSQSLSSLLVHLIFSTKDRCPFLGKSDLLQPLTPISVEFFAEFNVVRLLSETPPTTCMRLPTRAHPKCSQGVRNPQKQLFSVAEIPRNASFCLGNMAMVVSRSRDPRQRPWCNTLPAKPSIIERSVSTSRNPAQERSRLRRAFLWG